jgi:hypothetical protein
VTAIPSAISRRARCSAAAHAQTSSDRGGDRAWRRPLRQLGAGGRSPAASRSLGRPDARGAYAGSFRDSATRYDALVDFSFEWDGDSLKVPLAAIVEYDLNARLGGTGDELLEMDSGNVHTFGLGLYYSGRKDLQVGLFGALSLNLRPIPGVADAPGFSGSPDLRVGEFVIRYVW